ncbi:hypothetical protein ACERC8_05510 [Streptococcus sp. E29BA]|uniref:hypothetical protein n=1 Tax=Streptococcus sp. E29BA TaxID=3278716 RepID=UPI00359EACFA
MKIVEVKHQSSERHAAQGKLRDILREAKPRGYSVTELGGGHGNWLVYRKAALLVVVEEDGEHIEMNVTSHVKKLYGRQKLTKKLVETFRSDIATGKIGVDDL